MSTVPKKRWSQDVTEKSNALDLDKGVFTWKNPKAHCSVAETFGRAQQKAEVGVPSARPCRC